MLGGIGPTELIVIFVAVLIFFGAGRLPELGGALGKSIRSFKQETRELKALADPAQPPPGGKSKA